MRETQELPEKFENSERDPAAHSVPAPLLLQTIEAVDAFLHIRASTNCASTDANIPLSLGLPAISIGTGGQGGGAHTAHEWFHPDGRELGLRRFCFFSPVSR